MKFYHYCFDGEALGGLIIILAKNKEQADIVAEKSLKNRYKREKDPVKNHELELMCECTFDSEGDEVHFWDGEY